MKAISSGQDRIDRALARSFVYGVLASGFRAPRGTDPLDGLGCGKPPALHLVIGEPRREAGASPEGFDAEIDGLADAVLASAADADPDDLALEYQNLFGHTARGKVPPYETEYGSQDLFRQAQELADVGGFYRALGLAIPESRRERGDHVSAECEFLSFLAFKEAYDLARGELASAEEVQRVERAFLEDHLGRFVRAFARAVVRETRHPFYRALGELCFGFLTLECRSAGISPGPEFLSLAPFREDDAPMACGSCPHVFKDPQTDEGA